VSEPLATPAPGEAHRPWLRWAAFAGAILLWLVASVPTSSQGAARAIAGLLIALVARGVYRLAARRWRPDRPFLVPSLFVLAAVFSVGSYIGQNARDEEAAKDNAVAQGVVTNADEATTVDLCVAGNLQDFDSRPAAERQGLTRAQFRTFAERLCAVADQKGYLQANGTIYQADVEKLQTEAQQIIQQMRANGELG
jgi:hypothetical protein